MPEEQSDNTDDQHDRDEAMPAASSRPPIPGSPVTPVRWMLCCAASVLAIGLAVAPWLPWEADVSGWALLAQSNSDLLSNGQAVALGFVPPTVVLTLIATLVGAMSFLRRILVTGLALASATLGFVGTVFAVVGLAGHDWPTSGMGLAAVCYAVLLITLIALFVLTIRASTSSKPINGRSRIMVAISTVVIVVAGATLGTYAYTLIPVAGASTASPAPATRPSGQPGHTLWSTSVSSVSYSDPVVFPLANELVAIWGGSGTGVVVRDAATGVERWHYDRPRSALDGDISSSADARVSAANYDLHEVTVSADGRTLIAVYYLNAREIAVGLDAATGRFRWEDAAPSNGGFLLSPVPADQLVEYGQGTKTAIDAATGQHLWSQPLDSTCGSGSDPTMVAGAGLIAMTEPCSTWTDDAAVRGIDTTGRLRWQTPIPSGVHLGSEIDQVRFYTATDNGIIVGWQTHDHTEFGALDPATGRIRWTQDEREVSFLAADDHFVLTDSPVSSHELTIRDVATGQPMATQPASEVLPANWLLVDTTIHNGYGYLLELDAKETQLRLVLLNLSSGQISSSYPVPNPQDKGSTGSSVLLNGPAPLVPCDGVVMVNTWAKPYQNRQVTTVAIRTPQP